MSQLKLNISGKTPAYTASVTLPPDSPADDASLISPAKPDAESGGSYPAVIRDNFIRCPQRGRFVCRCGGNVKREAALPVPHYLSRSQGAGGKFTFVCGHVNFSTLKPLTTGIFAVCILCRQRGADDNITLPLPAISLYGENRLCWRLHLVTFAGRSPLHPPRRSRKLMAQQRRQKRYPLRGCLVSMCFSPRT